MKKTFLYIIIIFGIIGLIILYSSIGSPIYYINQPETLYVQNAVVTSLNSNKSNLPKASKYVPSYNKIESSDQFVNEPIVQLPSSNFESNTIEMLSNYHSGSGSSNSYTQYYRKSEEPSISSSTYSVMPIMPFYGKYNNQTESQGQFTPISDDIKSITFDEKQNDSELYANGPQKCSPNECGHWAWMDGYWKYSHKGRKWVYGYWYWVKEDCHGVPIGDGTVTIIVLLLGYSIFKYYKNEKSKQVLGTK